MTPEELSEIEARRHKAHERGEWAMAEHFTLVHEDIPKLIAEVRRLQKENAEYDAYITKERWLDD